MAFLKFTPPRRNDDGDLVAGTDTFYVDADLVSKVEVYDKAQCRVSFSGDVHESVILLAPASEVVKTVTEARAAGHGGEPCECPEPEEAPTRTNLPPLPQRD